MSESVIQAESNLVPSLKNKEALLPAMKEDASQASRPQRRKLGATNHACVRLCSI